MRQMILFLAVAALGITSILLRSFQSLLYRLYSLLRALTHLILRAAYARTNNAKHKFAQASDSGEFDRMMDMEIKLWQSNDVRTYLRTTVKCLQLITCKHQVNLPRLHVYTKNDHYFDHRIVEQHMRVVFNDFHGAFC